MVANVFHSPPGPRLARRAAARIVGLAAAYCAAAALLTHAARARLPRAFTRDAEILRLVARAEAPAALMMALAWNNALEGCLLAFDLAPFVVRAYPFAAAAAAAQLLLTAAAQAGGAAAAAAATEAAAGAALRGVWRALCLYYGVLLAAFAARFAAVKF